MESLGALTINDLQNFEVNLSFGSIVFAMFLSALSAEAIAIVYRKYARSLGNRVAFSQIFWLLATITTVVITIVKFSLALSLGLVGALSIVRFRAAIKEPEELVYLFLVIAIGLSMGAGQFKAGLMLTIFVIVAIIIHSKFDSRKGNTSQYFDVDVLTVSGASDNINVFDHYIKNNMPELDYEIASVSAENGKFEAVYRIYAQIKNEDRDELISWISKESKKDVSIRFGRSIKIPQ
jgi:uncharacterized membrane protein YhiD involved in acid resistance